LLAATPIYAQSETRITFTTLFGFIAGASQMPAGSYILMQDGFGHATIHPAQPGGKSAAILLTRIAGGTPGNGRASVSFVQRGGRYILDSVSLIDGAVVRIGR
jgi:hypothetical protein